MENEILEAERLRIKNDADKFYPFQKDDSTYDASMVNDAEILAYINGAESEFLRASSNPKGYARWVKAEKDLPGQTNEEYHLRYQTEDGPERLTAFYDHHAKEFYTVEPDCQMMYMALSDFPGLEWLEEGIAPDDSPSFENWIAAQLELIESKWKRAIDSQEYEPVEYFRGFKDALLAAEEKCQQGNGFIAHDEGVKEREKDAIISFMRWANENGWTYGVMGTWSRPVFEDGRRTLEHESKGTWHLVDLFLQSQNK